VDMDDARRQRVRNWVTLVREHPAEDGPDGYAALQRMAAEALLDYEAEVERLRAALIPIADLGCDCDHCNICQARDALETKRG